MLVSQVVAQQEQAGGGSGLLTFALPVALLVIFWLVLIRPQRKRQREMAEMQRGVQTGQRVMTGAGIIGTVTEVEDDEVLLEIAPGVETRFVKHAIVRNLDTPAADTTGGDEDAGTSSESSESDEQAADSLPVTHDDGRKKDS